MVEISEASSTGLFASGGFGSLGLSREMVSALESEGITRPTAVQQRGIPVVLSGANVILGAATGSGKTYAYLLPVVQMLKDLEAMHDSTVDTNDPDRRAAPLRVARRPRAVVVVPTRELALQTCAVAKSLSHRIKFSTYAVLGDGPIRRAKDALAARPVDVLVGTAGRLLQLLDMRAVDLRFTSHIIVDEVDTMFDAGFAPDISKLLAAARHARQSAPPQVVAAGATHPRAAETLYEREVPNAVRVNARLHRAPAGLTQRFLDVTSRSKLPELAALLGAPQRSGGRTVIFCNTVQSARFVDHYLRERGHACASVHAEIKSSRRELEYAEFRAARVAILVCTDCAARGLDNARVDHVIMFDFPLSAVDYLHRAGRTARAGASGVVTSLVLPRDGRLARAIQRAGRESSDALECAREAREEVLKKKKEDEARDNSRRRLAFNTVNDNSDVSTTVSVPFSSAVRAPAGGRGRRSFGGGASRRGNASTPYGRGRRRRSGSR